jgi:hypothetical protein
MFWATFETPRRRDFSDTRHPRQVWGLATESS